jgi:Cu+-exporting ATPase
MTETTGALRTRRALSVEGMTCASCVRRVERALASVTGVEAVTVNLATGRAEVSASPDVELADLIVAAQQAGYGAAELERDQSTPWAPSDKRREAVRTELRRRAIQLGGGGLLSAGVVVVAYGFGTASWSNWAQLVLSVPVWAWVGWAFHHGALKAARHKSVNMDTLVSLGSTVAFAYSVLVTILLSHQATYFDTAALIVTLIAGGKFLELLARGKAGEAVEALAGLQPRVAHLLDSAESDRSVDVDVTEVDVDDLLLILPGERVPIDADVVAGSGTLDESMISGESMPVRRAAGDSVIGGTLNGSTPLRVRVCSTGDDTVLAQILKLVDQAQREKPPIQRLADRISAVFVPAIIAISVATFLGWLLTGHSVAAALIPAVAVLVVACPCALGLATPVAILVSSGRGAELGLLVRGGETLEQVHALRTVILDKTGTLTAGSPRVVDLEPVTAWSLTEVLGLAAAVERASEHPIARAVVAAAEEAEAPESVAEAVEATPGGGVFGRVAGREVGVGSPSWLAERGSAAADDAAAVVQALSSRGHTVVAVAVDGAVVLVLGVADPIRPEAAAGVARLLGLGLRVVLATGDTPETAAAVAREVGIGEWHAQLRPKDKAALVRRLQADGLVAMVGDGVNDAPALATADVGIAIGSGTGVAMAASAITLVHRDVGAVADAIALSRATLRIIRQNLAWAFGYNVALIPLAVAHVLPPVFAALAMATSSMSVVTNALRLRRFQPTSPPRAAEGDLGGRDGFGASRSGW